MVLPAATVNAPKASAKSAALFPFTINSPPFRVICEVPGMRPGNDESMLPVLSNTSVPPELTIAPEVAVADPLGPLKVNVPPSTIVLTP